MDDETDRCSHFPSVVWNDAFTLSLLTFSHDPALRWQQCLLKLCLFQYKANFSSFITHDNTRLVQLILFLNLPSFHKKYTLLTDEFLPDSQAYFFQWSSFLQKILNEAPPLRVQDGPMKIAQKVFWWPNMKELLILNDVSI